MSASPVARQATNCQNIPSRRVVLQDASQLPHDYSTTPGGTLFSTTPGGTRIVYDRSFLLNLRHSPLSRTPPKNLDSFPDTMVSGSPTGKATSKATAAAGDKHQGGSGDQKQTPDAATVDDGQEQFQMDM